MDNEENDETISNTPPREPPRESEKPKKPLNVIPSEFNGHKTNFAVF